MKTNDQIRIENLEILAKELGSKGNLANKIERSAAQLSQWMSASKHSESGKPRRISTDMARHVEKCCNKSVGWMDQDHGNIFSVNQVRADYGLQSAEESEGETGQIEYWNVKGSCGGGFLNYDQMPKGHLIKEATFFKKYGVRPENTFAIYADGDSMADFIVDGDIVIFDKSKTTPISGKIFAIEHPDGLRIKVIRRSIDGSWTLESKNQDKRSFPDEVIPAGHAELLKIHGQFVYRQGG